MSRTVAFLSYTRKDDAFFGGYITQFSKMLENAVHVVTGDPSFHVFQDVEGLVIGEQWRKKLSEVIDSSSFLVPMLSPLFFNSKPCRDEIEQFLEHERALGRDDLILPIYFLTTAKLEKEEEKSKDDLAAEVARRQLFDWREKANVPLKNPAAREAVLTLARGVESAMARLRTSSSSKAEPEDLAEHPELTAGVDDVSLQAPEDRKVLWVDDNPDNNIWERRALESYGVRFVLARDTDAAKRAVREAGPFDAIVSDVSRVGDAQAGFTLLSQLRDENVGTPYFIYTAGRSALLGPVAKVKGAHGLTANPDALVEMVLQAIR